MGRKSINIKDVVLEAGVSVTTIHQPSFGLGAKAAEILIEHLEKKTKLPATLTLEPQLVVRDSVTDRQEE